MNKLHYPLLSIFSLLAFPAVTFAQQLSTAQQLVESIGSLVNSLIPIAAALALLGFFFGLAKYIFQAGNDEAQDEAKEIMVWGVIALFLIAAIGGIIAALEAAFGLQGEVFEFTEFGGNLPN